MLKKKCSLSFVVLLGMLMLLVRSSPTCAQEAHVPFIVRSAPTITNDWILPTSRVSGTAPRELALSACPGEYEPVSFVVTPSRDIEGLTVSCSDLTGANGAIGAAAIDIKLVKCWYQGYDLIEPWIPNLPQEIKGTMLLPELLVNDDDLVRVDLEKKQNLLRVTDPKTGEERYEDATSNHARLNQGLLIRDADTLQPVDIPAGQVRQFWVTVHVPEDASAGMYEGKLTVRCKGSSDAVLPLHLEVYPFKLAPSVVEQSIFYRGQLSGSDVPVIDRGDRKTETQYAAEMRNMVAHGVDAPLVYQAPANMDLMRRALEIRKAAGVSTDRFFFCAWTPGPQDLKKDEGRETRRVLGSVKALARSFGYREFYNNGPDEPSAKTVRQQIEVWRFVRSIGAKVYLACNSLTDSTGALRADLWNEVRDVVDAFVVGGVPNPDLAASMHEAGLRIYNYANPQCGIEEPVTYRRNYGLLLWKTGYDGAMNYAYQHGFGGHMWNDFDLTAGDTYEYRDHVMAYATSDGVVDTLHWEGYREGVDDLRYLSTLLEAIESTDASAQERAEAQMFVKSIDPSGDLDAVRDEIVRHILVLRSVIAPGARADTIFTDTVESVRFPHRGFAAWGDFNNDGWVDLYASGKLWRNDSGKGFVRVADCPFQVYGDKSSTVSPGEVIAIWGDFDNDGFLDLYVAGSGKLYRNVEGKTFVDVTDMLPERPIVEPEHPMVCRGAAWGDFDDDGFLDLYVGGFEDLEAKIQSEFPDLILKNNGGESFTEIWRQPGKPRRSRGVTAADFDEDGNMDVYVSNYRLQPNLLWRGDGTGTFTDVAVEYGAAGDGGLGAWGHTIGSSFADMDNDGHLDIFVGNFSHSPDYQDRPKFLRNRGPEGKYHFADMSANAGLAWQESFSTPALGDYDNDGNVDLFFATDYPGDKSVLYRNNGDWTFTNVTEEAGVAAPCTDQGAWADYDNDGDLDLASNGRLFVNTGNDHHWLKVRLVGSGKVNRAAIGSQVRVQLNEKTLTRHVSPSTGEGNQNDLTLHFGLGDHGKDVTMEIRWTDGTIQKMTTPVDRMITVTHAP